MNEVTIRFRKRWELVETGYYGGAVEHERVLGCVRTKWIHLINNFRKFVRYMDRKSACQIKGANELLEDVGSKVFNLMLSHHDELMRPLGPLKRNEIIRLHLDDRTRLVPWEIAYDDKNLLNFECAIGRIAKVRRKKQDMGSSEKPGRIKKALVVALNYSGTNDALRRAIKESHGVVCVPDPLLGKSTTRENMLERIRQMCSSY